MKPLSSDVSNSHSTWLQVIPVFSHVVTPRRPGIKARLTRCQPQCRPPRTEVRPSSLWPLPRAQAQLLACLSTRTRARLPRICLFQGARYGPPPGLFAAAPSGGGGVGGGGYSDLVVGLSLAQGEPFVPHIISLFISLSHTHFHSKRTVSFNLSIPQTSSGLHEPERALFDSSCFLLGFSFSFSGIYFAFPALVSRRKLRAAARALRRWRLERRRQQQWRWQRVRWLAAR
jgi:hypothetical protein